MKLSNIYLSRSVITYKYQCEIKNTTKRVFDLENYLQEFMFLELSDSS